MLYSVSMRIELLSWFKREGLLLTWATMMIDDPVEAGLAQSQLGPYKAHTQDEVKIMPRQVSQISSMQ